MTKKFDLYEELLKNGFERKSQMGATERLVRNDFCREIEVLFKEKVHLNEKRAFNAIRETVKNKSFEF